ncbi:hypothetical protein Fcan01_25890 [Folsomia candida]|uniref:Glutamate receptor ionotropic, delta-2 n=1 Tax=Folsomia candida TaxID=158441 RepID=A0A226D3W0_FOLCA|nr:hypothetical protein Fcan01_25890 [Folsomia candida]
MSPSADFAHFSFILCCILAQSIFSVQLQQQFPIGKFLDGVPSSCDLEILRDGKELLDYSPPHNFYPTTMVYCPITQKSYYEVQEYWILSDAYLRVTNLSLNTMHGRVGQCKISLVLYRVIDFSAFGVQAQMARNRYTIGLFAFSTERSLRCAEYLITFQNVTVIAVADANHLHEALDQIGHDLFQYSVSTYQASFIRGKFKLCSLKRWQRPSAKDMMCVQAIHKPLYKLEQLYVHAECWNILDSWNKFVTLPKNPFDHQENLIDTDIYISLDAIRKANISCYFASSIMRIQYPMIVTRSNLWQGKTYPLSFSGDTFITCYAKQFITFEFYLTPFQPNVWIAIGVSLSVLVTSLTLYIKRVYCDSTSFSTWLPFLASLFEETSSVPGIIEKRQFYRLTFGIWSLVAVLLTNCYSGIMINNLVAPLPRIKLETWNDVFCEEDNPGSAQEVSVWMNKTGILRYWEDVQDLFNFNLLSPEYLSPNVKNFSLENPFESKSCFRLLSAPTYNRYPNMPGNTFFYSLHTWRNLKLRRNEGFSYREGNKIKLYPETWLLSPKPGRELRDLSERNTSKTRVELEQLIENEVVKCGKILYVKDSKYIVQEYLYLSKKYYWRDFYIGKDTLKQYLEQLVFYHADKSSIPRNIVATIESGIWKRLDEEISLRKLKGRIKETWNGIIRAPEKWNSVPLDGSIFTLFVVCGILSAAAVIGICVEGRHEIVWLLVNTNRLVKYNLILWWWRLMDWFCG